MKHSMNKLEHADLALNKQASQMEKVHSSVPVLKGSAGAVGKQGASSVLSGKDKITSGLFGRVKCWLQEKKKGKDSRGYRR